jgi:pimeloyl-ACP methyl ester carboxylesterase
MNGDSTALPEGGGLVERVVHRLCAGVAWVVLHPLRFPSLLTPRFHRLPYQRVRLRSQGVGLAAWHIPREGSTAGIVLCHGHNDCRMQFFSLLRPLHEAGFHLLLFDFRSMGLSGGKVCTYGLHEQEDVLAAAEWLRREAGVERVGLFGISMGGASALLAAARDPGVGAVVADCAFARLEDMVEQNFHYLPARLRGPVSRGVRHWTERWFGNVIQSVDPEAAVKGWQPRPLLLIHGDQDRLTPSSHAERLAAAAGDTADLWIMPGVPHAACRRKGGAAYSRRVTAFFQRHLLRVANPQTDML